MSRQIQIRRGTSTEHNKFTGAVGEITMDTTQETLRLHNGKTAGGIILAKRQELPTSSTMSNNSFPSNQYIDVPLAESGMKYTTPADGYFYVQKLTNSSTYNFLTLYNRSAGGLGSTANATSLGAVLNCWIPVKKGDQIEVHYNLTGETRVCRFIYSQGGKQ